MNVVARLPVSEQRGPAELVDHQAEQALLGAILVNNAVMAKVAGWLRAEHFADGVHARIYEASGRLIDRGTKADAITLHRLFDQDQALRDIGGGQYLARLSNAVVTVFNADDYGRMILDMARKRQLLELADRMREAAFDAEAEAEEIIAETGTVLHAMADAKRQGGGDARELALRVVEQAQQPSRTISTGISALDDAMAGGLWPGRAYALRGQTKAGKSVLAGTITWNLNLAGVPTLYLGFEMTPEQLVRRNLARQLGVNGLQLLPGASVEVLKRAAEAAYQTPPCAYYERMIGRTLDDASRLIREHIVRHDIKGVIVDYIQQVRGAAKGEGKAEFTERVAYDLLALTGKHDVWIMFLSQLNRDGLTRWGDGLNFAVDQMFTLHRAEGARDSALVMDFTRDTPYRGVGVVDDKGNVIEAGLHFHKNGPYFTDVFEPDQGAML